EMDNIEDSIYMESLVIICDVSVKNMVSDDRYNLAKEVFVIDHHKNDCDITTNHLCDTKCVACAEYITEILDRNNFEITSDAATALYGGIITDSGRFLYGEALDNTFLTASKLIKYGAKAKYIYDNIYIETLEERNMKNYFQARVNIKDGVAYLKNDKEVFDLFPREFNDISRGMLSVMSGIDEIKIWLNFTYDVSKNAIIGEFRSRSIPIVDIAKKYGGGGHSLACGATITSWDMVDAVIDDFVLLLKENENAS
ncbi:MAG: bifunctional oligoribonuclease/PAP phosphatase NrnA, partial [Anaeroplasma sp.]